MILEYPKEKFCAQTFFAKRHTGDICGSNGLPLAPRSITMLGRAQILKIINHKHIAKYLDFVRKKHERVVLVSEYYPNNIGSLIGNLEAIKVALGQTISALAHLNKYGIVHRCLTMENLMIDDYGSVKLFNYGIYHMTGEGYDVTFPIGHPKYTAPEVYLAWQSEQSYISSPKVDTWSLGIIALELLFGKPIWAELKVGQCLRKVASFIHCDDVAHRLAREADCLDTYQDLDAQMREFVESCLQVDPKLRRSPSQLMDLMIFSKSNAITQISEEKTSDCFESLELQELYYLWLLAGGDVESELRKKGMIKNIAPILTIPNLVLADGISLGFVKDKASMLDLAVVPLSLKNLAKRLSHLPIQAYYPLLITKIEDNKMIENGCDDKLPLIIRERDTEYQFCRMALFKRLLEAYPFAKDRIIEESYKDIPPYYRGEIWAALLDVKGNIDEIYQAIDKETPIATDRQIAVDIPRCHQYNELLSSKCGHAKLKRILKAWVVSNPQYVYWQGLDSLCAPFLFLNFNNEARAFASVSAFIPKYLNDFFLKDNSSVIHEYLAKFSHLIAFYDPILANHLSEINFVPELFAIPWFLTMFSHVFPLHKILHLWDKLLLGDGSYALFIGLAILEQLRDTLLDSGFNECILLFSDLPEINMEQCVTKADEIYHSSPKSIAFRTHQTPRHATPPAFQDLCDQNVSEIRKEYCPRIGANELYQITHSKLKKIKSLIIDTRDSSVYSDGAVPGSINMPFDSVSMEERSVRGLPQGPELSILMNNKGNLIAVFGKTQREAAVFCEFLAKYCQFPKVCCVNGGIDSLKRYGIKTLIPVMT